MTDNGKSRFERAIEARMAVLGVSGAQLASAVGWTRAQFSRIKSQRDPSIAQVRRMALLLGVADASALMRDPSEVVAAPLPPAGWLNAVGAASVSAGFSKYANADDVWSLDRVLFENSPINGGVS